MVAEASNAMSQDPWLLVPTGGALVITVMAFGLIGDAVRDATMGRSASTAALLKRRAHRRNAERPAAPMRDGEELALSVHGLSVTMGGPRGVVTVLRDVSFDVAPGEAVGVFGESGCGKTITARAVLGLLPAGGAVAAGSIVFGGRHLTALNEKELSQVRGAGIALISQDPANSLDPTFTVGSQLREVIRRHHPQSRKQAQLEASR